MVGWLEEVVVNFEGVLILPKEFGKFNNQHIDFRKIQEMQIKNLKHFKLADPFVQSTDHSPNLLVTDSPHQNI
jgi:hypothetical protein